jgi:hypothetical protein
MHALYQFRHVRTAFSGACRPKRNILKYKELVFGLLAVAFAWPPGGCLTRLGENGLSSQFAMICWRQGNRLKIKPDSYIDVLISRIKTDKRL